MVGGVVKLTPYLYSSSPAWHIRLMHTAPVTNPYNRHRFPSVSVNQGEAVHL